MIMSSKKVNTDEYDTFECVNAENLRFRNCFINRYIRKTPRLKYNCGRCGKLGTYRPRKSICGKLQAQGLCNPDHIAAHGNPCFRACRT